MSVSTFDLFRIGIGPSSSHTVGPMRACNLFVAALRAGGALIATKRVCCELYGSLAATGRGHGTDRAVLLGLEGEQPERVDPQFIEPRVRQIRDVGHLILAGEHRIAFDEPRDLLFRRGESLEFHPNGLRLTAFGAGGEELQSRTYFSVGGGFVVGSDEHGRSVPVTDPTALPYPFRTAEELLQHCRNSGLDVARVMWCNELSWRSAESIREV